MELTEFLRARYDERAESLREDVAAGHMVGAGYYDSAELLADVEAKRRILELHESWPVMVQAPPELSTDTDDLGRLTAKMSQQVAWLTNQEYRVRFGVEPPTSPIVRALAMPFADHPDYDEGWRV